MQENKSTRPPPTLDELQAGKGEGFSPSKFMRGRRPELFSDSEIISEMRPSRDNFEYQLDTLTNRKQETEFEHFCRRLAQKMLCPNLMPQTGPVGGGDSKVDAETYPVADEIALRWYEGIASESSRKRWAFAFSAKRKWRSKLLSDVQNIANTKREYDLIYFITSQFVKDKTRAQLEDKLKEKHKISIRILDRSWIIKSVFENDLFRTAAETLNLPGYAESSTKRFGPQDVEKQKELNELEKQINDTARYLGVEYQLAEDCLQAALLARELELPRTDVDGKFLRAQRIAGKVNHPQQRLRITYARAWTAFWWHEDFQELNSLYDEVESLAINSNEAPDLELLANLWTILHTTVQEQKLTTEIAKLVPRTEKLKAQLEKVSREKSRPSNALELRATRILMDLQEAIATRVPLDRVLRSLNDVVHASTHLAEFPIKPLAKIIRELGEHLTENVEYDRLFEMVVDLTARRTSEGEAGSVLLQRGYQKLRGGRKYDAIRLLGRAQQKLAMQEYHPEWISALVGCALGYESAGLLWAARSNLLLAANLALGEYWKHGRIIAHSLSCLQRLIWVELQLGRVPQALTWIELSNLIAQHQLLEGDRKEYFIKERGSQDNLLSLLLLKTDFWELKQLEFLPHILETFGLYQSWIALLYALGYEDYLRSHGNIPGDETAENVRSLFLQILHQPASNNVPDQPELQSGQKVLFRSFVLGCEVTVNADNDLASLSLAETVLGILEALLATSLDGELYPYQSELSITISSSDFIAGLPEYQIDETDGIQKVTIRHRSDNATLTPDELTAFRSWLLELVLKIMTQIAVVTDGNSFVKRITRDELGVSRAMNLAEISTAIQNILGTAPKFRLTDWEPGSGEHLFPVTRKVPWNQGFQPPAQETNSEVPLEFGEGESPDDLFGVDSLKHKDRRILSLINIPLWDKANWRGIVYLTYPDSTPGFSLGFGDQEAGKRIFRELRAKLGETDENEKLRIAIVTGLNQKKPFSYRVVISANPNLVKEEKTSQVLSVARILTMDPPDSRNLNLFLENYRRTGRYFIVPSFMRTIEARPEVFLEPRIGKRELVVREGWQIGENDPDLFAIRVNDVPIIPSGVEDAPVKRAIQKLKDLAEAKKARTKRMMK